MPLPPVRGEPEREVDEPHDAEAEHPEQHPRADRAGRRLLRECDPAARVERERDEERDLGEEPVDVEEAFVPLGPGDDSGAEDPTDVDAAENEIVRYGRGVEDERGERERPERERRGGGESQKASPGVVIGPRATSSGSRELPRSTGAPYG